MNRRSFLRMGSSALGAAVAAPVLGPLALAAAVAVRARPLVYGEQRVSGTIVYCMDTLIRRNPVFLESRRFNREEICRLFSVPVEMVGAL